MNTRQLSIDSQAVALLCSPLGLSARNGESGLRHLTLAEWNDLARRIHTSSIKRPGGLFGVSVGELAHELQVEFYEAQRFSSLLDRGGQFAVEMERWANKGIWVLTRIDEDYPEQLRKSLKQYAPPVLFGAGNRTLLHGRMIAIVGSRNIDEEGKVFAQRVASHCTQQQITVVSGGARGTDAIAMTTALENSGRAVGVLADSLEKSIRIPEIRESISNEHLTLITPYSPSSGFSTGGAMGRNKIIYGMSDYAIVVASEFQKGGTWAGATEALRHQFCPVFVRDGEDIPSGNQELIRKGAFRLPNADLETIELFDWLQQHSEPREKAISLAKASANRIYQQPLLIPEAVSDLSATKSTRSSEVEKFDLYQVFLAHIKDCLQEPRTLEEVGEIFGLEKTQIKAWMKRALAEKRVLKKGRPIRFQSAA